MEQIFERFSATELDNVLHAINKYEYGDGLSPDEIQTTIWLNDKIAPPVTDAVEAILNFNNDLVIVTKHGKMGKRYKPGPYLGKFLYYGGFKGIYQQHNAEDKRIMEESSAAHEANLAAIDAAASAKRSADASEISAGAAGRSAGAAGRSAGLAKWALVISIIAALLSVAAFVKSFFN